MANPKKPLVSAVEEWLNLPTGAVGKGSKISLIDNREVCIEGCKGVLSYSQEEMRLHCGQRQLTICGRALVIKTLGDHYVEIEGIVDSVSFS